tara:strand:+ start:1907 stop:2500 length:594 start_codon:yes stop_codon:yes gene_type:complete
MGFDIYGLDPNLKSQRPTIDWDKATDNDKDAYFKALNKFEEENPGYYFRNNVWWWRPLANLIHAKCNNLLSDEQMEGLYHNNGTEFDEDTALAIARRLSNLIKNGYVAELEKSTKANAKIASEHNKKVEQKLADLKKEVERLRPGENLVPRDYPFPYNKHFEEIYSTKNWDDSYPFDKENVKEFINFARHSGGFQIC